MAFGLRFTAGERIEEGDQLCVGEDGRLYKAPTEPKIKVHTLEIWPDQFQAIYTSKKNFEWRKNDRDFKVGDVLCFRCWSPATHEYLQYPKIERRVTYILYGPDFDIPEGYCIMQLADGKRDS